MAYISTFVCVLHFFLNSFTNGAHESEEYGHPCKHTNVVVVTVFPSPLGTIPISAARYTQKASSRSFSTVIFSSKYPSSFQSSGVIIARAGGGGISVLAFLGGFPPLIVFVKVGVSDKVEVGVNVESSSLKVPKRDVFVADVFGADVFG